MIRPFFYLVIIQLNWLYYKFMSKSLCLFLRKQPWQIMMGIGLLFLAALLHAFHYLIYRDAHHMFFYTLHSIAFMPIEVLLVSLILHQVLNRHEKKEKLHKLNMVIGVFFSELGTELIEHLALLDPNIHTVYKQIIRQTDWNHATFKQTQSLLCHHAQQVELRQSDLQTLRDFLLSKRGFMLQLLENPNMLEHDAFSNLLWATFHITEELQRRKTLGQCSDKDLAHLALDVQRVYCQLTTEWLIYLQHLQRDYPYLFSFALRTNPFNPEARIDIV